MTKIPRSFYTDEILDVTPKLLGKYICRKFDDGTVGRFQILEVEAYCGEHDLACHASKGRTQRTEAMYSEGGHVYVYLIYGMYWLLNITTGKKDSPQAALIRSISGASGPGRAGRLLKLDKSFYNEDLTTSSRIWLEDMGETLTYECTPRIGIKYAGKPWVDKLWRFVHDPSKTEKDPTDQED
ncbi:DNA-3-methyladenine glycosylase family protein [Tritrichomonas foetus]|uniref:DNA-3-methyladenine glycosylase II n=1 Tax=Tritrichomonas foetus TaxID=1144522 RepID=A0A1J4KDQ2_9EUKA|nr:DNA-3-methyladenine glycosylase family protein [Tritrichomonas foetus]|eukprot:OHT07844.1 DNA-3-methyladenine glycosylase family protein [Tritrichomonas foetus]